MDQFVLFPANLPGAVNALWVSALALASGAFWLWVLRREDVYEPEPGRLMLVAFSLGVTASCLTMVLYDAIGTVIPPGPFENFPATLLWSLLVVGLVEEGSKGLVVYYLILGDREVNERLDGMIYAGAVGLGFASAENYFYIHMIGSPVLFGRFFFASVMHLCTSSIFGYYMARYRLADSAGKRAGRAELWKGLWTVVFLHGLYDAFLFQMRNGPRIFYLIAIAINFVAIWIFRHHVFLCWLESPFRRTWVDVRRKLRAPFRTALAALVGIGLISSFKWFRPRGGFDLRWRVLEAVVGLGAVCLFFYASGPSRE